MFILTCVIEPKFTDKPPQEAGEDEVSLAYMSDEDKALIFSTLGRTTREIKEFFRLQTEDLESVHNGETNGRTSKRRSRSKAVDPE